MRKAIKTTKRFLKAWVKKDHEKMYNLTQQTWRSSHDPGYFKKMFEDIQIDGFLISELIDTKLPSRIEIRVRLKKGEKWSDELRISVVCEKEPMKPHIQKGFSFKNYWGVNPISVLRVNFK